VVAAEDDSVIDEARLRPAFRLLVALAGREHPARVIRLSDGGVTVALGDPDAAYLARCLRGIEQLLSSLHERGIEAVVAGIDDYGRPEPDEGFLHLLARTHEESSEQDVERLRAKVEASNNISIAVMNSRAHDDMGQALAWQAHFAWDPEARQAVRRNWSPKR
jgi:hypothetical protein